MSKRDMSDRDILIYLARELDQSIMLLQDTQSWESRRRCLDGLFDMMGGLKTLYERHYAEGPDDYLDRHLRPWRKPLIV